MTKIAGSESFSQSMDPRIRIRTKMSWIRNTAIKHDLPGAEAGQVGVSCARAARRSQPTRRDQCCPWW
jgi:hypothetical protein